MTAWIAPTVAGVVGVVGIVSTFLTAKQGREHAEKVAAEAAKSALQLALFNKRNDAYLRLLQLGFEMQQWLAELNRQSQNPGTALIAWPDVDKLWAEMHAIASAFSSKAIAEAFKTWVEMVTATRDQANKSLLDTKRSRSMGTH